MISIVLVVVEVFLFLRELRSTFIPGVSVPLSWFATFAVMYLLDYTLDNLSLMALTLATGFVVDDVIVVMENITRHLEDGMTPTNAALKGSKGIGFTVVSMSLSLMAVFIPIPFMGGIVGRLFREFAITLSFSILVPLLVSLSATPMLSAKFLKPHTAKRSAISGIAFSLMGCESRFVPEEASLLGSNPHAIFQMKDDARRRDRP